MTNSEDNKNKSPLKQTDLRHKPKIKVKKPFFKRAYIKAVMFILIAAGLAGATIGLVVLINKPPVQPTLSFTKIEGGYEASGTTTTKGVVTIPSKNKGEPVIAIAEQAFLNNTEITEVKLPSSIRVINASAFNGCKGLEKINLPEGLVTIETSTFNDCIKLKDIIFPSTLKTIKSLAFSFCYNLGEIVIPSTVTTIQSFAFRYNSEQVKIYTIFKEDERPSGWDPDWYGSQYTMIYEDIRYSSAAICWSFETAIDGVLYKAENGKATVSGYTTEMSDEVNIPSNVRLGPSRHELGGVDAEVTKIKNDAFNPYLYGKSNHKLSKIYLPNTITEIGDAAFSGCANLEYIFIPPSVLSIGSRAFISCRSLKSVIIPSSVINMGEFVFSYCGFLFLAKVETSSKPSGWDINWNIKYEGLEQYINVEWGYKGD